MQARKLRDPKARLRAVWDLAKAKNVCEGSEENDDMDDREDGESKRKRAHGGCGYKQPTIRKDGLKLYAQLRSNQADVSQESLFYDPFVLICISLGERQ